MDDAPKEKPESTFRTIFKLSAPGHMSWYIANNPLRPKTPRPTTPRPMTEPPAKATSRALPKEVLAACVVLTLALVATRIPIKPARAEQMAPTTKDTATLPLEPVSLLPLKNNRIATATTNTPTLLYAAFIKDMAPLAMLLAIRTIFSVPSSCLVTHLLLIKTKRRPNSPKAGNSFTIKSIV